MPAAAHDPATSAVTFSDPGGYEVLASWKLPGPHYLSVLEEIHAILQPDTYIEIGVRNGDSLRLARNARRAIGVDPAPSCTSVEPGTSIVKATSDEFFARPLGQFDLAFIDGDHSFDQALRDFTNLEQIARPGAVILLHDVIPMDPRTATPVAQSSFWTGDAWRLMELLVRYRFAWTVACPFSGLGVVTSLCPQNPGFTPEAIAWARCLSVPLGAVDQVKRLSMVSWGQARRWLCSAETPPFTETPLRKPPLLGVA